MYACLHTLSGKSAFCDESKAQEQMIVKTCYPKKVRNQDKKEYYLQLNPNKGVLGNGMIKSYSEFETVLFNALEEMQAINFRVTRADLCFNSDNISDYELFKKLNKLLICCIADAFNIKNCYQTAELWSNKSLSVAVKNDVIEAENYDKSVENPNVPTKNRLELRSKRITGTMEEEFLEKWFCRLDKAMEHFELVQKRYNQELYKLWFTDQERPQKDRNYISLTAFLLMYKDCIFTRKQLVELLQMIGVENPVRKAKNFKERHTIEFYSKTDLKLIIKALKQATINYFCN